MAISPTVEGFRTAFRRPSLTLAEIMWRWVGGATAAAESSKLPFTGLDIGLVIGAGGILLAMGFGIRRLSRSPTA